MEAFVVGMVFLGIPAILGWIIKNNYAHQRFMKVLQLKSEMNARLLDRLGTDPGVLDVLKSDVQQKMFEITLPEAAPKMPAAHARMLTSAQVGLVLLSLGGGFLYIRQFVESRNDSEFVLVLGTIAIALGLGAVLSAGAAFLATRLWQNGGETVDQA
jgi:membrane-bound ClpP family serine protease